MLTGLVFSSSLIAAYSEEGGKVEELHGALKGAGETWSVEDAREQQSTRTMRARICATPDTSAGQRFPAFLRGSVLRVRERECMQSSLCKAEESVDRDSTCKRMHLGSHP